MFHLLDSREGINAFLKENGSYSAKSKYKKTKRGRRKENGRPTCFVQILFLLGHFLFENIVILYSLTRESLLFLTSPDISNREIQYSNPPSFNYRIIPKKLVFIII